MIPWTSPPVIRVEGVEIHGFSITAAAAVLVWRGMVLRRAQRQGIARSEIVPLYVWMCAAGALAAAAGYLYLGGMSSLLVAAAGLCAGILCCGCNRYTGAESLRLLDTAAFAVPFAAALGRLGCALAHEHPRRLSNTWLAVRYPGGARYDLGLLDFLFLQALCVAFIVLDRRSRPGGFFLATGMAAYSAFRILRGALEDESNGVMWAALFGAGIMLLPIMSIMSTSVHARKKARQDCPAR